MAGVVIRGLLLIAIALSSGVAYAEARKKVEPAFNAGLESAEVLVYKKISGGELRMLKVNPPNWQPTSSVPAVLFFFGGGWRRGQPSQFAEQAHYFASRGMVVFCVDYRVELRQGTTPFECVADGKSAVRWVRSHAATLGIDPARIGVAGGSAGGHVAVATAILPDLEEEGADTSVSCVPNAVVLYNPVIDTSEEGYGHARLGQRWRELSPLHHVAAGLPPMMIFHGTADTTTPHKGVQRFTEAMTQAGNTCSLQSFDARGHGFYTRPGTARTQVIEGTDRFLASLGWIQGPPTYLPAPSGPQPD
jgi:acetyl esterase